MGSRQDPAPAAPGASPSRSLSSSTCRLLQLGLLQLAGGVSVPSRLRAAVPVPCPCWDFRGERREQGEVALLRLLWWSEGTKSAISERIFLPLCPASLQSQLTAGCCSTLYPLQCSRELRRVEKEQEAESTVIKEGCLQRTRLVIALGLCLQQHQLALWPAAAVSQLMLWQVCRPPAPLKSKSRPALTFPQTGHILDGLCQEIPRETYSGCGTKYWVESLSPLSMLSSPREDTFIFFPKTIFVHCCHLKTRLASGCLFIMSVALFYCLLLHIGVGA